MKLGFKGEYLLKVSGGARGEQQLASFPNVITDSGLDRFAYGNIVRYCFLGSGTTPEATSDTSLVAKTVATDSDSNPSAVTSFVDDPDAPYAKAIYKYRFKKGRARGTHTEIAVGWENDGSGIWSRALIKDQDGSPLAITVLDDEVLDVYYTLYFYYDTEIKEYDFIYKGVSRRVKMCFADITRHEWCGQFYSNSIMGELAKKIGESTSSNTSNNIYNYIYDKDAVLGTVKNHISGYNSSANSRYFTTEPYVLGSHYRDCTAHFSDQDIVREDLIGGIDVKFFSNYYSEIKLKATFDPPLEKNNTEEFHFKYRISWARHPS